MIRRRQFLAGAVAASTSLLIGPRTVAANDDYLTWSLAYADQVARSTRRTGKVGSRFNERLLKTERAVNFKLIATWMTPDVIRATARWLQLSKRLSATETRQMVVDAESIGDTVMMVELDPHEGSGVIPNEWETYLQPRGAAESSGPSVRGTSVPKLRSHPVLSGVERRNYDYDRFWIVFPLATPEGQPLFDSGAREAELVTRVFTQEERTYWPISSGVRR